MGSGARRQPLVSRYYGLMLGFFVHFARLELPAATYAAHRARINEVMRELELDLALPETHVAFATDFEHVAVEIVRKLKKHDAELADFYAFGFHALGMLSGVKHGQRVEVAARDDIDGLIARYGLDGPAIRETVDRHWNEDHADDALWVELVGRFYRLATIVIWPLGKQDDMCFVIMPFGEPFGGYYFDFYRPALRHAGYRCIRAWVGLTNELYLNLLAVLISRCSAALADISAQSGGTQPNLNVIHEIGLNMGLENVTFLIRNQDEVAIPSNFTGLRVLSYDTTPPDFPAAMAVVVGAHLRVEDESHPTESGLHGDKPGHVAPRPRT